MSILKSQKGFTLIEFSVLVVIVACIFFIFARGVLVDENDAVNALNKQGYSKVKVIDRSLFLLGWRGCSVGSAAKFTAEANNLLGQKVTLFVCVDWPLESAIIGND
ncbi:MAG: hypothetical protein V1928_02525 [Parcubacteria group bacterium]